MTDHTDLIARADAALDGVTPGPWADSPVQWPEQIGCCPLIGRPFSINGTDFNNVSASNTQADARFIAASRQLVPDLRDALAAMTAERDALRAEKATLTAEAAVMEAENARLREALRSIVRMASQAADAPLTADRWLDRIDETALAALGALAADASAEGGER